MTSPTKKTFMKGWQYTTLSGLKIEEGITLSTNIPAPTPSSLSKNQLLISVISAAINPADYKMYEVGGILSKLLVHTPGVPGLDYCGRITSLHPLSASSSKFKVGDIVFGCLPSPARYGSLAEKMVVSSSECALLPKGLEPELAAAAGTSAITAYLSLPPSIVKPGSRIFLNGGSGGVGTWGIQIAKAMGAHVTTSCSTGNMQLCKDLGADEVIDYKTCNILVVLKEKARDGKLFDLVVDNAGVPANLYEESAGFLKVGGEFRQVAIVFGLAGLGNVVSRMVKPGCLGGGKRKFVFVSVKASTEGFGRIGKFMEEGRAKPVVDRVWEMDEVKEAFAELKKGRTRGKMVVRVGGV